MEMKNFSLVEDNKTAPIYTMADVLKAYFDKNKGTVTYAFFTTYDGMDISVLEEMLCLVPGGNKVMYETAFDVCCGAKNNIIGIEKSHLPQLLLLRTHRILVQNAFHPKIMMFYYKPVEEESEKIFLVIGSKNLTDGEHLDAYVCFEGKRTEGSKTNGEELQEILTQPNFWGEEKLETVFSNQSIEYLNRLRDYRFELWESSEVKLAKPLVSFHRPSTTLLNEILSDETDETETIVVSPFVTDKVWNGKKFRLYTSFTTARTLQNRPQAGVFYLGFDEPSLHAKIYIKHSKGEAKGDKTKLWIGSSNFTVPAFSNSNSEILACLTYEDSECTLYKNLRTSFEETKNDIRVWQEMCLPPEPPEGSKKGNIPLEVYKELGKKLGVISVKQVSDTFECEYLYNPINLQSQCVKDIKITPEGGTPTRNGCVSFVYITKDEATGEEKEQRGNFSFDLLSKFMDEDEKEKYEEILKAYIKRECQEYNRGLLNPLKKSGVTKRKNKKGTKTNQEKSKKITLFDLVFQLKFTALEDVVKTFLSNYKNSYIGELPENEAQLIKLYLEV